ncbi:MAG: hypothetical protein RL708_596 [Bacteroidota bacterium]
MIKKITLLFAVLSLFSFRIYAQTVDVQSTEGKTKVYKYKLKLQPIPEKADLDFYIQNVQNEDLFEYSIGNFNFDKGAYQEKNMQLLKSLKQDSTDELNNIEKFKKASLKSLSYDSAKVEVYINAEYNYSCITIGGDTLIGIKKFVEPTINYYYTSKKVIFFNSTDMGSLNKLHSSQSVYSMPELPFQILGHNFTVSKTKFLNKMYSSTTLLTNEISETSNLIYDFQYPSEPNSFPLQFNIFRNGNKYCFELVSEKELSNSKAISKKIKTVSEKKVEKVELNQIYQMVGFDY